MQRLFLTGIVLLGVYLTPVMAQAAITDAVTESLIFSLRPERPKPYETVTLYIESYSIDLSTSDISWFVNGSLEKSERGSKNFVFQVGGGGSSTEVIVVITTLDGATFRKSLTIRPADVSLLWEAEGYTPPFYKGKARFSYQGSVRVVAVPSVIRDGVTVAPQNLVYTWKKDGKVIADQSGYGKNILRTQGTVPIRPLLVEVEVATTDSLYVAGGSIVINPERSFVVMYEQSPIYGILFNHAVQSTLPLSSSEIIVSAIPFFFDSTTRNSSHLSYEWRVNGERVSTISPDLVLRREGAGGGETSVSLRVANTDRLFQFANSSLTVSLSDNESSFFNTGQ